VINALKMDETKVRWLPILGTNLWTWRTSQTHYALNPRNYFQRAECKNEVGIC
jgi:hypothetical protein